MLLVHLYVYLLPILEVAETVCLGVFLARSGRRNRNASVRASGAAVAAAGVVGGVWLAGSVASIRKAGSFATILLFVVPARLPILLMGAAVVGVAAALSLLRLYPSPWQSAGYTRLPGRLTAALSLGVLLAAGALAWDRVVGPWWQLRPYSSLASTEADGVVLLQGLDPHASRPATVISIDPRGAPGWRASFELGSLDAAGEVTVRLWPPAAIAQRFVSIPFEGSAYALEADGTLTRLR